MTRARRAQPAHHLGVVGLGGPVGAGAVRRDLTRDVDVVLDRDRHAEQWQPLACVEAGLRGRGLPARRVGEDDTVCPQLWIQPEDAVQVQVEQRGCGDAPAARSRACSAAPANASSVVSTRGSVS